MPTLNLSGRISSAFTGLFPRLKKNDPPQHNLPEMIFVCGCGHSGTSLVTAMFGFHKDIYAINEETYLFASTDLSDEDIRQAFREKYSAAAMSKKAKYLCEKTPIHIRHLDRIRSTYPGVKFFIPVRDPRDVTLSIKLRTGDLKEGYVRWLTDNAIVKREMGAGKTDIFVFRYEDLIEDVSGTLTKACNSISLPFDPMMLEYYKDKRGWFGVSRDKALIVPPTPAEHIQLRDWQIKQPILERRGRWRTRLSNQEIEEVETACSEMMKFFDYRLSA